MKMRKIKSYYFIDGNDHAEESTNFLSKIPWTYIIMGFIILCIIFAVSKVIRAFSGIFGPLVGAGGNIMNQFAGALGDCVSQKECPKDGTCDNCASVYGCGCTTDQKSCEITTRRKVGEGGGPFGCALSIITLSFIFAPLLLTIVKFFMNKDPSPALAEASKNSGKDVMDLAKQLKETSEADIKKSEDDFKEKNGKEISEEGRTLLQKTICESNLSKIQNESAKNLPLSDKQTAINNSKANYEKKIEEIEEAKSELDEKEREHIDETIKDNKPNFEI